MPCDESQVYMGSTETVDSPRITAGSRRSSSNKILTSSSSSSSGGSSRSLHDISQGVAVETARNHYGTVAMAPRPLHPTTTFSTSRSSSSSSSTASSTVSSFERQPRNESTNSSSSLILILKRTDPPTNTDNTPDNGITSFNNKSSNYYQNNDIDNERNIIVSPSIDDNQYNENSMTSGFSGKVAASSLENLAKKKSSRSRRRRSAASPRKIRYGTSESREINENQSIDIGKSVTLGDDGFVATSTLTKNHRDVSVLSVLTNTSRSAGKIKLQSSISRTNLDNDDRDITLSPEITLTPYAPRTIKSQKSTISIASIRGTNIINNTTESSCNNNYSTMLISSSSSVSLRDNALNASDARVRCNVPSASAPTLLHNNHNCNSKHQNSCISRGTSLHSTSSLHSSVVPLAVISSESSTQSTPQRYVKQTKNKENKMTTTTTTCKSTLASPVKAVSCLVASPVFADTANAIPIETVEAAFARIDSSASLKSSSFTACKMMKIHRDRKSLHASLGQLPITTSSCAPSTIGGDATSLENLDSEIISTGLESNVDPSSIPLNLYTSNSPVDPTTLSSCPTTRTSLERVCFSTGASTTSSLKTPILTVASTANSTNVVNTFKNSLVASGNNNNNSNNNGRCNHSSGTCTGNCTGTTTSQTSSTLPKTPNLVAGVATTSSWTNNSVEQETDYVVDPVQGNAYHKGQFLGKGGFARVYLMTDVANGNQYACKIIPKNRMQKIHIQKIAREIMIHKELNHVNVVQMHHYFEDNINVYMLLEPCPRKSLMHVLRYRGKVTEPEARYYMKQMVTGVAYIHSQKVVHRDLKPGNMFLSDGMIVKIGDFGLATRPDGQRRRVTICGTPNYIAPEVLYKQAYSYEADVWALGCILYALLAGQPPFDTATLKETYARICNNRYKKLDDSVVSRSGQDLIRWLLQPIPELRPSLERVKEHAYLTMEYVPTKLAHTCCYRMPPPHSIVPEQTQLAVPQQLGLSCNSIISRGIVSVDNIETNKREIATGGTIMQKNINHMTSGAMSQSQLEAFKNNQKKPKVGNWLFRKLPKLPRFRQRLSKLLCPEQKKPDSVMMHRALEACLAEIRCTRAQDNPMLVDRITPLFVTKWIDYSNKYGLGFQLSDRSVGVLFNDSTKMSYTHDRRRVEYATTDDDVTRYRRELDVPSCMEEKLELLRHFTHYMDNFLTNGGEVREQKGTKLSRTNSSSVPRMRRWLRTDKAIVMELTVPLLQVNFFVDHSKIVVSEGTRGRGYLVTYIDASRQASSYWLNDLRDIGCTAELYERLHYVCKVIAELENEAIFDQPAVTNQQHRKAFKT